MIKKLCSYILVAFLLLFSFLTLVDAKVTTYERTEDNLGVKSSVKVTNENKKDILNTPKVDEQEKVYDFAELFSSDDIDKLKESIAKYTDKFGMDMLVVTIDKNNKEDARHYADDFYEYNDFGMGKNRSGILFLIDMDTRKIYITTGGDAIGKYDDSKIENMLNASYNYVKDQKYYEAANAFIVSASSKNIPWILIVVLPFLVATIPTVVFVHKNKMVRKKIEANQYIDKDSIKITEAKDIFITTNTVRTAIQSSSGGGSSTHSGGGGMSFGGGGKSF